MPWTYDPTQLASNTTFQVRRLVGDVIKDDPQVQDEEILFALTQRPNIYGAAAFVAKNIAAQFARKVDVIQANGTKITYSSQARYYQTLAATLERDAVMMGSGTPYAGGISVADKQAVEQDTDRVAPQFNIGMMDNTIPVGSVGNELPDDSPSATDLTP